MNRYNRCFKFQTNFYSPEEFAHYSLLNNHFYQSNDGLITFFSTSKCLAIMVDPPFGVISDALENSLNKLKQLYLSITPDGFVGSIVFLPVFIGKHLNDMHIVDYKV